MAIEWNRVTWYSKLFAVVVFTLVFVIAFYLGEEYASIKQEIALNADEATVSVGQTSHIGGLDITFNKLLQDSRCPADVTCIWAGAVNIDVTFKSGSQTETKNISSDKGPYAFNGYQISIVNVLPGANSKKQIKPSDYKITFHVDKKL